MLLSPVMGTPLCLRRAPPGRSVDPVISGSGRACPLRGPAGRYSRGPGPGCCSRARLVRGGGRVAAARVGLAAADAETADQAAVALDVGPLQVLEETATATDQGQKTATRVVVVLVELQVLGQVGDALGEHRDLDLGRTGVALDRGVLRHDVLLLLSAERHGLSSSHRCVPEVFSTR